MPPVEQDALIYGPIRVELLTHKVLAQGKFVRLAKYSRWSTNQASPTIRKRCLKKFYWKCLGSIWIAQGCCSRCR